MISEVLDIIGLVSSMTLGHIIRAISSCTALSPSSLLISIKGQRVIRYKMPKYKSVLDNILARQNDPGYKAVHSKLVLFNCPDKKLTFAKSLTRAPFENLCLQ